jgi:Spy/CpxP family protein refolding chaperone
MKRTSLALLIVVALGLWGGPSIAQQADRPTDIGRLERARLERLQGLLELNDHQTSELEAVMRDFRRQNQEAGAERRQAMQRLRQALAKEPVNDDEVRSALDQLETQRRSTERLHEQQRQRLGQLLTPQQRAKFMLFNEQFDARVRQLMAERRSHRQRDQRGVRQPRGSNALQNQPARRPDQQRPRD